MIYIAHRGNFNGRNPERENTMSYINEALRQGLNVEIDVWFIDGSYYLGHDAPGQQVDFAFLTDSRLWCHAKNHAAINRLLECSANVHCFWHDQDAHTITSKGNLWTFPKLENLVSSSIFVMPETTVTDFDLLGYDEKADALCHRVKCCAGICSDWVLPVRKAFSQKNFFAFVSPFGSEAH